MSETMKAGIIGCGAISGAYLKGCKPFDVLDIVACADLDMTQTEFGRLIGAPQSTIARLESGTQAPSVATLTRIAQATGTELVIEFRWPKRKRRAKHPRRTSSSAGNARPTEPVAASGGDDPRGGSDR